MNYREDKKGNKISQLGFGCMRFTKRGNSIIYDKAKSEILAAVEGGVNYFDTAYIYPGSEAFLGKVVEECGLRDKIYIATKLPQYMLRTRASIDKTFKEELERLRTDYVDYYLMHMMTDYAEWEKLESLGIKDWIEEHKKNGSIRNIGFSYHGETEMFLKILNAYDWDFCQIQYNYYDENSQAGRRGLEAAYEKNIPVIIMEPLRGGKLVNVPDKAKKVMKDSGRDYTPAEWGFRWLWDQPGVTCILSGMNSVDMVNENVKVASEAEVGGLTPEDHATIESVRNIIKEKEKVGCTGCRYCMPCPKGVDIPGNFFYYNLMYTEKKHPARMEFAQNMALRKEPGFASQCIECGKCEQHCPQHINIREKLKEADAHLRPAYFKLGLAVARKFMLRDGKQGD